MIPKSLKLYNFLSHDHSEINFERFDIALILGTYNGDPDVSNGSGKSSLFAGLCWALFGKSQHRKKSDVVKYDRKSCCVEFEFWVDEQLYCIRRTRDRVVDDSDVAFYMWDGVKFVDKSCDTPTMTNNKIEEVVRFDYDVFINSVYFRQGDISVFSDSTAQKKKEVIKSLLRLDRWDKYQNKVKDRIKSLGYQIKEKSSGLVSLSLLRGQIEECKSAINTLKSSIKVNTQELTTLNSTLMSKRLEQQALESGDVVNRLSALEAEYEVAKETMLSLKSDKVGNDNQIKLNQETLSQLQRKIVDLKERISKAKGMNLDELRSKLIQGRVKEKTQKATIQSLEAGFEVILKCEVCKKRELGKAEVEEIKAERRKVLAETKQTHEALKVKLHKAEEKLEQFEGIVNQAHAAEVKKGELEVRLVKVQGLVKELKAANERIDAQLKEIEDRRYEGMIEGLRLKVVDNSGGRLAKDITELEGKVKEVGQRGTKLNIEYGSKIGHRDELVRLEAEQVKKQAELDGLNSELALSEKLKDYFGKDGIQAVILEGVVAEMENGANDVLSKICSEPSSISIITQRQNDVGNWVETFDIQTRIGNRVEQSFESLSGGEQFRISMALRLALSSVLSGHSGAKIDLLLLDEVSSSLDNRGVDMFVNVVRSLGREMKVLVISHDEKLKDKFPNTITINKSDSGSKVSFV